MTVQALMQPAEVYKLAKDNYTISLSGDPSKGEDWDFVLENKNKIVKSCIPKGGWGGRIMRKKSLIYESLTSFLCFAVCQPQRQTECK